MRVGRGSRRRGKDESESESEVKGAERARKKAREENVRGSVLRMLRIFRKLREDTQHAAQCHAACGTPGDTIPLARPLPPNKHASVPSSRRCACLRKGCRTPRFTACPPPGGRAERVVCLASRAHVAHVLHLRDLPRGKVCTRCRGTYPRPHPPYPATAHLPPRSAHPACHPCLPPPPTAPLAAGVVSVLKLSTT